MQARELSHICRRALTEVSTRARYALLALLCASCSASDEAQTASTPMDSTPIEASTIDSVAQETTAEDSRIVDTSVADSTTVDATTTAGCGAFPKVVDLASKGPFGSVAKTEGACVIVRPSKLGEGGVKHPVVLWGNGTGALVSLYQPGLELWASHGFIVAAANISDGQGSGKQMLACLDWVLTQNTTSGSIFENKVCPRAGATGHSQGGGGALMAGRDPRVIATAPLQPYTQMGYGGFDRASFTTQVGPMLLLSGGADDNAVPSIHQKPVFDTTNVPVVWASLNGGDHYSLVLGITTYREPILAWFRLQLLDDEDFRPLFYGASCGLCTNPKWTVQRRGIM